MISLARTPRPECYLGTHNPNLCNSASDSMRSTFSPMVHRGPGRSTTLPGLLYRLFVYDHLLGSCMRATCVHKYSRHANCRLIAPNTREEGCITPHERLTRRLEINPLPVIKLRLPIQQ